MHAKAYQGGSYRHLHSMLGVSSGAQVLYVGDHIYGDILRSKKTLGWRTMLVVPELAHEMECLERAVEEDTPGKLRTSGAGGRRWRMRCNSRSFRCPWRRRWTTTRTTRW